MHITFDSIYSNTFSYYEIPRMLNFYCKFQSFIPSKADFYLMINKKKRDFKNNCKYLFYHECIKVSNKN